MVRHSARMTVKPNFRRPGHGTTNRDALSFPPGSPGQRAMGSMQRRPAEGSNGSGYRSFPTDARRNRERD